MQKENTQTISATKQKWLDAGYEHFALFGPENLSINKISKEIGSSRACFYHYFGDIENFVTDLLDMHWQQNHEFCSIGARACNRYFPDLYLLLEQYPLPLQFSKQLFINRKTPAFNYLFIKTYNASAKAFILKIFSEQFDLKNNEDTHNLWLIVGEAWYSRLDINDLTAKKMQDLAKDIMDSVLKFVSSNLYSNIQGKPFKK